MEFVMHHDETAYLTRSRELAFLANTLARGILRSVAAVHAPGGVRCGRMHLQSGPRVLVRARAWRDLQRASSQPELDDVLPTRSS